MKRSIALLLVLFAVITGMQFTFRSTAPGIALGLRCSGQSGTDEILEFSWAVSQPPPITHFELFETTSSGDTLQLLATIPDSLRTYVLNWPAYGQLTYFGMRAVNDNGPGNILTVAWTSADLRPPADLVSLTVQVK